MLRLGIIGMNDGNGHPYSYSALFNGYDPKALAELCPFPLIKEYLPKEHRNENQILGAKVTHVWTQDQKLSKKIAQVSLIPNIVEEFTDLLKHVDAVLIARDDPENHLHFAKPFLEAGMPLFIDKQLTSTLGDYQQLKSLVRDPNKIMAGSPVRYSPKLSALQAKHSFSSVKSVHGVSRVNWMRYGHHLFEAITKIWGLDIEWVRSLCDDPKHDILQITYREGPKVTLEFFENAHLPMQINFFSEEQPAFTFQYDDFFGSFKLMLENFVSMIETRVSPIAWDEICAIAQVVLAGQISKQQNGTKVRPRDLGAVKL